MIVPLTMDVCITACYTDVHALTNCIMTRSSGLHQELSQRQTNNTFSFVRGLFIAPDNKSPNDVNLRSSILACLLHVRFHIRCFRTYKRSSHSSVGYSTTDKRTSLVQRRMLPVKYYGVKPTEKHRMSILNYFYHMSKRDYVFIIVCMILF